MKIFKISAMLVLVISLAVPGSVAEPNAEQSGDNGLCEDYNVLFMVDGVISPLAPVVQVDAGTQFVATQEGGAAVTLDWFDADGIWVDYNSAGSGTVPTSAAYGVVCVGLLDFFPDLPAVATWTYQDGF